MGPLPLRKVLDMDNNGRYYQHWPVAQVVVAYLYYGAQLLRMWLR